MSWHERMNKAIDYIESNLCQEIDYNYVAKMIGQSTESFQRTFSVITEMSVSEYIRRRRLCLASYELQWGTEKIIDIAMKYGYESPEAFARAFREIYGVSPSLARKENAKLRTFPRISFQLTIKGDVVMNYKNENATVQITNMYCEHLPALRLIGKRYTRADMDADFMFGSRWNEWFQNGWFDYLGGLGCLPGFEFTGIMGFHAAEEHAWWICMFFPLDTEVPEGFSSVDLPEGDVCICWMRANRNDPELFKMSTHDLCTRKLQEAGCAVRVDFDGIPCKWSFERFDNKRFFTADEDGKVTLDYGTYIVASEASSKMSFHTNHSPESMMPVDGEVIFENVAEKVIIPDVAAYTPAVENNSLIHALATLFLKLENYSDATPYYCARQGSICNHCGECGELCHQPNLYKHHQNMYHHLLTVTGVAFLWGDSNETGDYDLKYIKGITPPLLEDRLDFAMKVKGLEYSQLSKTTGEQEVFRQIAEAIHRHTPVLMKTIAGANWHVAAGFNKETGELYAADLNPIIDWYKELRKVIIVTERAKSTIAFDEVIERIAARLQSMELGVLETLIPQMLDSVTHENARSIADYLNHLAGYAMDGRWHGAEAFGSTLLENIDDKKTKAVLLNCMELLRNTSDICWQIWGELGIGPHTNYRLPNLIIQSMQQTKKREALKSLFAKVFANDRLAAEKLNSF